MTASPIVSHGGGALEAARRSSVAVLLALLLCAAAGLLPAAAPGLALATALVPGTALAADDVSITTATRYTLVPDQGRVRVVVDVTALNEKPNQLSGGTITRYFYEGVNLAIQPEARSLRATQEGVPVKVDVARRKGYRLATVLFRQPLYYQETAKVRLSFDLPGGAPRSDSAIRVGAAFATFSAWAFGDRGSVRVEVPGGFRVEIVGEDMEARPGTDGLQAWSATTASPLEWYAWVNATNDDALTRDHLALSGGDEVVIRGWPDDRAWRARVRTLLRDGVPELVRRIGLAWPVDGSLVVTEVYSPLLEGYAGFYDTATDEITISEDLDDLTIVHEASHAWFNKSLFTERWITEGLADEYATRVLRALDLGDPSPAATSVRDAAAFPLSDWSPPGAIRDEQSQAREEYGYAASWALLRGIVRLVGEEGMREVFAAAAAGTTAYPGEAAPERSRLPNDWRRFLDLAQGVDDEASIADLVSAVALDDAERRLLPARAAARGGYADLVAAGGTWAAPVAVRMALDGWRFDDATDAMGEAEAVLTTRDELSALAATEGLDPPAGLETAYQDAESTGELAILGQGATRSLDALRGVAAASAAVEAPRDWATELGLDGADPDANLAAARAAWEAGEVDTAQAQASEAVARLAAAPEAGRSRALVGGGVGLALVLLGILGVVLLRRRGRDARRARAWAAGSRDAGTLPGGAWPYATLRPDGPPAEPPGEPMSGDEGADPS